MLSRRYRDRIQSWRGRHAPSAIDRSRQPSWIIKDRDGSRALRSHSGTPLVPLRRPAERPGGYRRADAELEQLPERRLTLHPGWDLGEHGKRDPEQHGLLRHFVVALGHVVFLISWLPARGR